VIRYNWFEEGFWNVDLVDPEGSAKIAGDADYGVAYVYGNIFVKTDKAGNRLLHWGGDGKEKTRYRSKSLEFYNNTFVDRGTGGGEVDLFQGSVGCDAPVHAYNNVFYSASRTIVAAYRTGTVILTNNWIKTGWKRADGGEGRDGGSNITGDKPGFVDYEGQDYHLAKGSPCIDAGTVEAEPVAQQVTMEYVKHQKGVERAKDDRIDIGAYEAARSAAESGAGESRK
jgi:hypothetical protein